MGEIKLGRLPDRTPVKLSVMILPELHRRLLDYAALYAQTYGVEEPIVDLIPAMLAAFIESDRTFARKRASGN